MFFVRHAKGKHHKPPQTSQIIEICSAPPLRSVFFLRFFWLRGLISTSAFLQTSPLVLQLNHPMSIVPRFLRSGFVFHRPEKNGFCVSSAVRLRDKFLRWHSHCNDKSWVKTQAEQCYPNAGRATPPLLGFDMEVAKLIQTPNGLGK